MSWAELDTDRQAEITAALTELQLAVVQARLNNHSWTRIADSLNLDEATVRGHHKRAIRRLNNARKDNAA